ncbi:hypothetical protein [Microbacterium trichothecenolyticum]|uniref:Uncharacterized protein n=1 Tax=Microbacterium trichothecenolyticum TaxID=69370 RepID=A0ABU0TXB5_MICTR|nr:hypothetical protein [Microbacterium trichothecenolyticum]MDQ1124295.1 hypothetical protein [Microbacterium trichothecenolyticum]
MTLRILLVTAAAGLAFGLSFIFTGHIASGTESTQRNVAGVIGVRLVESPGFRTRAFRRDRHASASH